MNVAIVLSGGLGTRMNSTVPKQYIKVQDKMIISYVLETLVKHAEIDLVVIVAEEEWQSVILDEISVFGAYERKIKAFAQPGITRQCSIYNALEVIEKYWKGQVEHVLIHDAARPNITESLITECLDALHRHEGVMPVLTMKDTVYISEDKKTVTRLLDRDAIFAGQAPEAFHFEKYFTANKMLLPDKLRLVKGSTEVAVLAGMDVVMISGDEHNYKITTAIDLERFQEEILKKT